MGDEIYRGHSDALNLDLCWEDGELRWYDPVAGRYLLTYKEVAEARIAERRERIAAEQRADAAERRAERERDGRLEAEARAAQLESELRRLRGQ